jgi:PPOX class probable F420-dependent enzyme
MEKMSRQECLDFIMQGTRTGKLATVRADGRPHVVPVWFIVDGDTLVFTTWHESVKAGNLRRDPRVSICVDEEIPPYAFVMLEGTASISEQPDERLAMATRIGGRYMGENLAKVFGKRNAVEGEWVVRVTLDKVIGRKDMAG